MMKMARMVAYDEGLPVVADPGILSPQAFVDELFNDRFPNEYLGDTNLRLAVDVSQMVGIRFGETVCEEIWRCFQIDSNPAGNRRLAEIHAGCR